MGTNKLRAQRRPEYKQINHTRLSLSCDRPLKDSQKASCPCPAGWAGGDMIFWRWNAMHTSTLHAVLALTKRQRNTAFRFVLVHS